MSSPLVAGNLGIAKRWKSGRMLMGMHADSIYNNPTVSYAIKHWRVDATLGVGGPAHYLTEASTSNDAAQAWATFAANDAGGTGGPWMWYKSAGANRGRICTGTGTSGADSSAAALALFAVQVYNAYDSVTHKYPTQEWLSGKALTYSILWENEADGFPTFLIRASNGLQNPVHGTTSGLSAAGTPGTFSSASVAAAAYAYQAAGANDNPRLFINGAASTDYTGKKLRLCATRVIETAKISSGNGFMLAPMTEGGTTAGDWATTANWSQAAMNAYTSFMGLDTIYIALGQNTDVGGLATYKANLATLADRYIIANPAMQFVWIPPYQTDPTSWDPTCEEFCDAMYDVAMSYGSRSLFLNQWRAMAEGCATATEAFNFLKTNYMAPPGDVIHMSDPKGRYYLTHVIWSLVEQAISQLPGVTLSTGVFRRPY